MLFPISALMKGDAGAMGHNLCGEACGRFSIVMRPCSLTAA